MASSKLRIFNKTTKLAIPAHFRCPVSLDLMEDPVTLSTGITYDRHSIETWLDSSRNNRTCPVTNQPLTDLDLIPNHAIRRMIQDWCVANKSLGIERIPTPRAPVTPTQVLDLLTDVELASWQLDRARALELVARIKNLAKESERNRRCISSNGAAKVLAMAFARFVGDNAIGSEVLSILTSLSPLDAEVCKQIGSPEALKSMVSVLRSGDLASRLNAVLIIKEVVSDGSRAAAAAETEGLVESITKLIKEPISPRTTKASLMVAYYLVASSQRSVSRFVELGLVSLLLETVVDCEKSVCEKALGVLDGILSNEKGREMAYLHALTMPVLVKKMFRVSDMATEFAVSALWKLCKNCRGEEEGRRLAEGALSVGAFQKLLLLLQLGCSEGTRQRASELLKMLNAWRGRGECIESADFRGLKRNF